jgi:hypothetical protein
MADPNTPPDRNPKPMSTTSALLTEASLAFGVGQIALAAGADPFTSIGATAIAAASVAGICASDRITKRGCK